jgi:hypothetical protein
MLFRLLSQETKELIAPHRVIFRHQVNSFQPVMGFSGVALDKLAPS